MSRRGHSRRRRSAAAVAAILLLCVAAGAAYGTQSRPVASPTAAVDPKAVPLGDGHISSTPKVGYVDSCVTAFGGVGGAQVAGPWIDTAAKTWDYTAKVAVDGAVRWPSASYSVKVAGSKRVVSSNDLPLGHASGVFPVASSDPAFAYDRNPNRLAAHATRWSLPLHPAAARKPSCTGLGPIGVLSDGAYLYNALDAEGRDAAAHEVLDACAGHPDRSSSYHHHSVPPCILGKAPEGRATLVGYALDGYGIFVVKSKKGTLPANTALDACHGTTSVVPWNGKPTRIYHYVATLEYPYTVGCYHGTPTANGRRRG